MPKARGGCGRRGSRPSTRGDRGTLQVPRGPASCAPRTPAAVPLPDPEGTHPWLPPDVVRQASAPDVSFSLLISSRQNRCTFGTPGSELAASGTLGRCSPDAVCGIYCQADQQ